MDYLDQRLQKKVVLLPGELDKNLGTLTPDKRLLKQLGFVFEEDLYGGQKGKTVQERDPKESAELGAELAKSAVAPGSTMNPGEAQRLAAISRQEIQKILDAQKEKGITVIPEPDDFNKDAKPAVITSFDKTEQKLFLNLISKDLDYLEKQVIQKKTLLNKD